MLVRLYGAEDDAKTAYAAGQLTMPFTDVGTTAAPYVAWLYENGIVNGVSATKFGTGACSAKMYCAFLLRALGYQDGVDFQYADTLAFAQEKGFYDPIQFSGTFLRDDLAAVTYQALGTDLKDGSAYLLKSLIDNGAVDAQAATPMTEKIEAYRALQQASAGMDASTAMDVDVTAAIDMTVAQDGETVSMPMTMDGGMQMILDEDDLQMAYDFDIGMMGDTMTMREWLTDGWVYVETEVDGETVRTKTQVDLAEQLALIQQAQASASMDMVNVSGLAMVDSITVSTSGGRTVYTMVIDQSSIGAVMDAVLGMLNTDGSSADAALMEDFLDGMNFSDITAVYTVGSDGQMRDMRMQFSVTMGTTPGAPNESLKMDYDMTVTVNATGDSVRITFPNFSNFEEVTVPEIAA